MQLIYQFFRLIRFMNIVVIVLTMFGFYGLLSVQSYYGNDSFLFDNGLEPTFKEIFGLNDLKFILLIISVVLIAASGNIINDYFDQKADRINKPKRLIIDKYIKRRWAIFLNWTFNGVGILISFYLSFTLENWWIFLISFLSINLLYFYSAIYKRKFLKGNIIVAFLTAIIPLYVYVYATFSNFNGENPFNNADKKTISFNLLVICVYCAFAFLLNLIREIIKDMADVKGDLLLQSKTFPIRFGLAKTKLFLGIIYLIVLLPLVYYIITKLSIITALNFSSPETLFPYLLLFVLLFVLGSIWILFTKNRRNYYLLSANFIKIAMLFGVISVFFYSANVI